MSTTREKVTAAESPGGDAATPPRRPLVEVVVPVHNERRVLAVSVRRLHGYLTAHFPFSFRITIADNASTDGTWAVATALAAELPHVRAVHLAEKGRGRALRHVWSVSDADVVSYMDVDLSTDLAGFLPLVAPLVSGHSEVAIGTRLARASAVVRGPKRELISRCYNLLLRVTLRARFSDAQCGFKAVRADVVRALLPAVEDQGWFFDTELLLVAQRLGLRIHEVPVDWIDDPDSRVDVVATAIADLRGMARVARRWLAGAARLPVPAPVRHATLPRGMARQLPSFAAIGVVSTLAHLGLFWILREYWPALVANAVALLLTAVANTAANRRFTFGVTGPDRAVRHQIEGGVAFLIGLLLSSGALGLLHLVATRPPRLFELVVLVGGNALATLVRFVLLRAWVFHPARIPASEERGERLELSDVDTDLGTLPKEARP